MNGRMALFPNYKGKRLYHVLGLGYRSPIGRCLYYLVRVKDSNSEGLSLYLVLVVNESLEVVLTTLIVSFYWKVGLGLVFFWIFVQFLFFFYSMVLVRLMEPKERLRDLLGEGFISLDDSL